MHGMWEDFLLISKEKQKEYHARYYVKNASKIRNRRLAMRSWYIFAYFQYLTGRVNLL